MDFDPLHLSRQLQVIRMDLVRQFRGGDWKAVGQTLGHLARVGQSEGRRELCLRAQSLQELVGHRGHHAGPSHRLEQLFHDLLFHLSHLEWIAQCPPRTETWNAGLDSGSTLV